MWHKIGFCLYNVDKPATYDMLYKAINFEGFPYLHRTVAYARNLMKVKAILIERLYASIPPAKRPLDKKITMMDFLKSSRSGIAKVIKNIKDREYLSTRIFRSEDGNIVLS